MRKLWCVLLGVMVGLLAAPTTQAQTNVNDVVSGLKDTRVYIAPGVEGTNQDTAGQLADQLNGSDKIVLVMLPANGDDDPGAIAQAIDKATDNKYIVGLSVGSELTATSTIMPDEVARDLMQRAVDTGTNPTERLGTFARNVHGWQADHPNEPASKEADKGNGSFVLFAILFVVLVICIVAILMQKRTPDTHQEIKIKASPGDVRDILRKIQDMVPQINDPVMCESVMEAVSDTEAYFRRSTDKSSRKQDADVFIAHLTSVKEVLVRYIDIQDNSRYFDHPRELMEKGLEAVNGFNKFALQSIKDGRKSDLTQFNVDTAILSAQRYR